MKNGRILKREDPEMDRRAEITTRLERLSPELQEEVLRFVVSLTEPAARGENGALLLPFAGTVDALSAEQMRIAIDEGCERVDSSEW